MPFTRIDLARGKPTDYRAGVAEVIYAALIEIMKAPEGDRFMVISEHEPENFVYEKSFFGMERTADVVFIQVTTTVGNTQEQKVAFFRYVADELNQRLGIRREDVFITLVFTDREDWSFGGGKPW